MLKSRQIYGRVDHDSDWQYKAMPDEIDRFNTNQPVTMFQCICVEGVSIMKWDQIIGLGYKKMQKLYDNLEALVFVSNFEYCNQSDFFERSLACPQENI